MLVVYITLHYITVGEEDAVLVVYITLHYIPFHSITVGEEDAVLGELLEDEVGQQLVGRVLEDPRVEVAPQQLAEGSRGRGAARR